MEGEGGRPGIPLPPAGARLPESVPPPPPREEPMDEEEKQAALEEKGTTC